jgi:nucleoside-diphosphate-sugar epimerase
MKTLVVGGAGFLGSHLVPFLIERGHEVTVQDIVPVDSATRLRSVVKDISYTWKSILDATADDLDQYDHVIHLAAQGDAPLANSSPKWTFTLNLDATMSLLEAARHQLNKNGTKSLKLLYMSSDSVYGRVPPERLPASENEPMHPTNTYGASKAAAEHLIDVYWSQFGVPIIKLRSTTMFGEGSRPTQAVPIFIRQALNGEPIVIEGDGSQTRDINYVKNVAEAILNSLASPMKGGTWNIGSGKEISIRELAELIVKLTGSKSRIVFKPWRPGEQGLRLFLSIEKARRDIQYVPSFSTEDGLKRTIDFMRGAPPSK